MTRECKNLQQQAQDSLQVSLCRRWPSELRRASLEQPSCTCPPCAWLCPPLPREGREGGKREGGRRKEGGKREGGRRKEGGREKERGREGGLD